jgi:hypothetical protein
VKNDYSDILRRVAIEPWWFDKDGVPRYDSFVPKMVGYTDSVAYLEIACQSCDRRFMVASEGPHPHDAIAGHTPKFPSLTAHGNGLDRQEHDAWDMVGSYHYGDPPRHDTGPDGRPCCSGSTMNSVPIEVREFWMRGPDHQWHRHAEFEIAFPPL